MNIKRTSWKGGGRKKYEPRTTLDDIQHCIPDSCVIIGTNVHKRKGVDGEKKVLLVESVQNVESLFNSLQNHFKQTFPALPWSEFNDVALTQSRAKDGKWKINTIHGGATAIEYQCTDRRKIIGNRTNWVGICKTTTISRYEIIINFDIISSKHHHTKVNTENKKTRNRTQAYQGISQVSL